MNISNYKWMSETIISNIEGIKSMLDSDISEDYREHIGNFFAEEDEYEIDILSEAIADFYLKENIDLTVKNGVQSIAIIFPNEEEYVLKMSISNLELTNNFINDLNPKFQKFFEEYILLDTYEDIIFYLQKRIDCKKTNASQKKYPTPNYDIRDGQLLATMLEYEGIEDAEEAEEYMAAFEETCGIAADKKFIVDIHSGNWGMLYGKPIIFDPVVI